jgi:predicted DNA-binding transcriptional regulator YafY
VQRAAAEGRPLWIGYLNAEGEASRRLIEPHFVEGGAVVAYDHRRSEVRTFLVHRITGVATIPAESAEATP